MNKTFVNFGQGWWEKLPNKLTEEERGILRKDDDPEARSKALRDFENRSRQPASPEDCHIAESVLKMNYTGEYLNANVVLPEGHGGVTTKEGKLVRF